MPIWNGVGGFMFNSSSSLLVSFSFNAIMQRRHFFTTSHVPRSQPRRAEMPFPLLAEFYYNPASTRGSGVPGGANMERASSRVKSTKQWVVRTKHQDGVGGQARRRRERCSGRQHRRRPRRWRRHGRRPRCRHRYGPRRHGPHRRWPRRGLGGHGGREPKLAHAPLHRVGVAARELLAAPILYRTGRQEAEVPVLERIPRLVAAWSCAVVVFAALALAVALAAALVLEPGRTLLGMWGTRYETRTNQHLDVRSVFNNMIADHDVL